jgi:hypothetical protein
MKDKLAIIVPYRDRQDHLDVFIPHMNRFLLDKGIDYTIFIAEQADDRPFNYGKLCNVVVNEISKEYTYFCFHDIDMLPLTDDCDYSYPDTPTHLATNVEAHRNKLPYPQYFGGVVLINREDFEFANGYSNEYWGYGFEDLDLLKRLEKSDSYLEKYYDLHQVYSYYDNDDILPYRIENIEVSNTNKTHTIKGIDLPIGSRLYGPQNPIMKSFTDSSFTISLWFKDTAEVMDKINLFTFEGCDTGLFLSEDVIRNRYVTAQIWDNREYHYEVSVEYYKNRWNNVVFVYNKDKNTIKVILNNRKIQEKEITLNKIFDYSDKCIKISELETSIKLADIVTFDTALTDSNIKKLYYNGISYSNKIASIDGIIPTNIFTFESVYNGRIILDKGKSANHIKIDGTYSTFSETINLANEIYLPVRIQADYKSLVHKDDSNIINRYYIYDPDVEENADIFFNEVLRDVIDFKKYGLNTLKYTTLDCKEMIGYVQYRIVT